MNLALFRCIASVMLSIVVQTGANATDWQSRPIKVTVAFTAGSATDIVARILFQKVSTQINQTIIVENRGGAGGTLAAAAVAKSDPDGYTMLLNAAGHTVAPWVYPNLSYDTLKDFAGITTIAKIPNVLVVSGESNYQSLKDLVAAAKAKPGVITFASSGIGTASHLNAERFRMSAGINVVHVPFRGAQEGLTEVMARRVDYFFVPVSAALSLVRSGKLRALAVGSSERTSILPDVPTTLEQGFVGSDYTFWMGIFYPRQTSPELIERMSRETATALQSQAVKERLAELGAEPMMMKPADFDAYLKADMAANEATVKGAGIVIK